MEVWRLSSKRLAAPTFFVRGSPELPLLLTTNNRSRHDTRHKWRMCRGEAERKQKTQSQGTAFYHRNGIQGKQKADLTDGFTKIIWRKFFFLTIYPYLCNKQSGSLKWQNKVKYRSLLVSISLPTFIDKQFNLLIILCL